MRETHAIVQRDTTSYFPRVLNEPFFAVEAVIAVRMGAGFVVALKHTIVGVGQTQIYVVGVGRIPLEVDIAVPTAQGAAASRAIARDLLKIEATLDCMSALNPRKVVLEVVMGVRAEEGVAVVSRRARVAVSVAGCGNVVKWVGR